MLQNFFDIVVQYGVETHAILIFSWTHHLFAQTYTYSQKTPISKWTQTHNVYVYS